jgi:hypothetical protein
MKNITSFLSILLGLIYFSNEMFGFVNQNLSDIKFVGASLIYASIPIMLIAINLYQINKLNRDITWSCVAGTISRVEERSFFFVKKFLIEYTYYVNDISYANNKYSTTLQWCSLGRLMVNPAFKNGKPNSWKKKRVKVYYNNKDIWDSVLERSKGVIDYNAIALPSINMILISAYCFYTIFI